MTAETRQAARERLGPYVERAQGFSGWSPSVQSRALGPSESWDYMARAKELAARAAAVVDLGTGGGERFATIIDGHIGRGVATEEWHVNAPVARKRLRPLGVEVVACSSRALPFVDASFDLVLDRHEALNPAEVGRILRVGGTVLTQQVWHLWDELDEFFPRRSEFGDHFHEYQAGFQAAGMAIVDAREHVGMVAYGSLGDLVYMLCISPWDIPGFDPLGADLDALLQLEAATATNDGVVLSSGHYLIEARTLT